MPSPPHRKCLIVLGMHRSGTSAVSGVLQIAGLDPGKNLLKATEDNSKGFFENALITHLNDEILASLYTSWSDTLRIPGNWHKEERFNEFADKFVEIINDEFLGERTMTIKDPRLSVLLPFYLKIFERLAIEPVFLLCNRNPVEIAASLDKRNHLAKERSLLLWMDYSLKAELYSRGFPRIMVSYPGFLADPVSSVESINTLLHLGIDLSGEVKDSISSFIDPAMKHHNQTDAADIFPTFPGFRILNDLLCKSHLRDLSDHELKEIDEIRKQFFREASFFTGNALVPHAEFRLVYEDGSKSVNRFPISAGINSFEIKPDPRKKLSSVMFIPAESEAGLILKRYELISAEGQRIDDFLLRTNAIMKNSEGLYIFSHDMPRIVVQILDAARLQNILIQADYLALGQDTGRLFVERSKNLIERMRSNEKNLREKQEKLSLIQEKSRQQQVLIDKLKAETAQMKSSLRTIESQLLAMKKSIAWKTGRIITAPGRLIAELFLKPKS